MLTDHKLPLGQYIAAFVEWLTQHGASTFDLIASTLESLIHGFTAGLNQFLEQQGLSPSKAMAAGATFQ